MRARVCMHLHAGVGIAFASARHARTGMRASAYAEQHACIRMGISMRAQHACILASAHAWHARINAHSSACMHQHAPIGKRVACALQHACISVPAYRLVCICMRARHARIDARHHALWHSRMSMRLATCASACFSSRQPHAFLVCASHAPAYAAVWCAAAVRSD